MVWYGGLEPLIVPTRWALLGVSLGGAPMWPCGAGIGFTERSAGRRIHVTYKEPDVVIQFSNTHIILFLFLIGCMYLVIYFIS